MTTLRSGSASDVGRVRTANQDVALEGPGLFAVADGMGGHVGGEVAARVAVDTLRSSFQRQPSVEGLRRAVAEANRAVWRQSQTESGLRGMGTTLTATALVRDSDGHQVIALANVGDSRAYVYSKGQAIQVTADHSLAEEKVRQGELTEAEAAVHPHRHILTRALGVASDVDVDLWELHLQDGDRILLCSDGLTNEVGDEKIAETLADVADPQEAAGTLVRAALDHGGNDNITVVVIDVVGDDTEAGDGAREGSAAAVAGSAAAADAAVDGVAAVPPGVAGAAGDGAPGYGSPGVVAAVGSAGTPGRGTAPPGAPGPSGAADRQRPGGHSGASAHVGSAISSGAGVAVLTAAYPRTGVSDRPGGPARPTTPGRHGPRRLSRKERRRQRRMAGIPRLVTFRLFIFLLLVAGVVAGGYVLIRWYATDDWYVTIDHQDHLVVYQGRPGGFLWFKPKLVYDSPVTTKQILADRLTAVKATKQEPSLAAARAYITNLNDEYLAVQKLGAGATPNPPTSSTTTTNPTTTTTNPTTTTTTTTTTSPTGAAGSG